jgi:hypothetical protein
MTRRSRIPALVYAVAVAAAALHMAPVWHAQLSTPEGWEFTGNHTRSPDYMQYRTWTRQSADMGPIVDNRFTTEPHVPYLPVFYYYAVGKVSQWTGTRPAYVNAYAGALLAFLITILLYRISRHFLANRYQATWVTVVVLFGGGLAGHLYVLDISPLRSIHWTLARTIDSAWGSPWFESQRQHLLIKTLFDTHFLLIWTMALLAMMALYRAIHRMSPLRLAAAALSFAVVTLIHLYTGITLVAGATGVAFAFALKRTTWKRATAAWLATGLVVFACLVWCYLLFRGSGLPLPDWEAPDVLISNVLFGYPIAWLLIAIGGAGYWRDADLDRVFLAGWAIGCVAITLSAPFYPYTARGTITLLPVLYLIAAVIYFAKWDRVTMRAALLLMLVVGVTPVWETHRQWEATAFTETKPFMFIGPAHRGLLEALTSRASPDDILLADYSDYRWLSPEFPGRSYHAHFFLTVDFERKRADVDRFFSESDPQERLAFLLEEKVSVLFVNRGHDPAGFESVPGLEVLVREDIGTLFAVAGPPGPETPDSEAPASEQQRNHGTR